MPDITYTSNKISKNIFIYFLATIINSLIKNSKFKYKNTTPGDQKGEVIIYTVQ